MLTPFAFQTNIRAEAHHCPLIRAAGMWFPQTQVVVQLQIRKHGEDYTAMTSMCTVPLEESQASFLAQSKDEHTV